MSGKLEQGMYPDNKLSKARENKSLISEASLFIGRKQNVWDNEPRTLNVMAAVQQIMGDNISLDATILVVLVCFSTHLMSD